MTRRLNLVLIIGLIGTPIAGALLAIDYGRAVWGDDEIWWTPAEHGLSLDQARGTFRLYLEKEPIEEHLARSSLTALGRDGMAFFVTPDLLEVRLNNWERMRAERLHVAVYEAFALGIALACFVVGTVQFFAEPPQPRRRIAGARPRSVRR